VRYFYVTSVGDGPRTYTNPSDALADLKTGLPLHTRSDSAAGFEKSR
jgi:hypothetical protein